MTWYIDALGSAASLGVDVFCRETLTGDWLETIGSWQQADGLVLYTPHPSFWVAALWRKLMGREVLEATVRAALPAAPPPAPAHEFIPWVRVANVSCVFGDMGPPPGTGSALAALLLPPKCPTGDTNLAHDFHFSRRAAFSQRARTVAEAECQRRCEASRDTNGQPNCTIYDWASYGPLHNRSVAHPLCSLPFAPNIGVQLQPASLPLVEPLSMNL